MLKKLLPKKIDAGREKSRKILVITEKGIFLKKNQKYEMEKDVVSVNSRNPYGVVDFKT